MKYLSLQIEQNFAEEEALAILDSLDATFLYSTNDPETNNLILYVDYQENPIFLKEKCPFIISVTEEIYEEIDWDDQWKIHCPNYKDGIATIDLSEFIHDTVKKEIFLKPGPGFGDLSHPTTAMTLQMVVNGCENLNFIDVGCGSGILSFAAHKLGAKMVIGYDIDDEAILHANNNKFLNSESESILFQKFDFCKEMIQQMTFCLIAMNMIESEQDLAFTELAPFLPSSYEIITSGIKKEQKEKYLQKCASRNWKLYNEESLDGWCCFHFRVGIQSENLFQKSWKNNK